MQTGTFPQLVRKYINEELKPYFVPDSYEFDFDNHILYLVENVKYNDLSEDKIDKLAVFWMDCDNYGWEVKLKVNHHYGLTGELNLQNKYYELLQKLTHNKNITT